MTDTHKGSRDLDLLFAAAREAGPTGAGAMPDQLADRILADARQVQAGFAQQAARRAAMPDQGLWAQLLGLLGGWPALGGLATACAAGVWIGLAPPSFLPDPAGLVLGQSADIDLMDVDELYASLAEEG